LIARRPSLCLRSDPAVAAQIPEESLRKDIEGGRADTSALSAQEQRRARRRYTHAMRHLAQAHGNGN